MKAAMSGKAARKIALAIVNDWRDSRKPDEALALGVAEAIEKAVKAERRACARIADGVAYEAAEIDAYAELVAVRCGRRIRARSRS